MTMQPAPSETTKPRREREKGQLAACGGRGSSPSLGRYAPFIVANPATIGSTSGKSTAPQMATSAIPWAMNIAPRISELLPVAQAVTMEEMGPVAPVAMATLPPTMLMQELGFMKGWGSFPVATSVRSASISASSPPMAELNVTATRGASLRRDLDPGPRKGAHDHEQGVFEDGRGPVGHLAGPEKRIGADVDFRHLTGDPDGKSLPQREAGQRGYAALPRRGPAPLRLQLRPQGRYAVISENDGSVSCS